MTKGRNFYVFFLLQAAALVAVLVPFFRWNNLLEWDFPGHFAAIWYLKTHLFPWPTGWNPYFYCGYPQGIFYPPLAHYLATLLSFPLGIALAMKVLVAASLLLLPLSFHAFARRWGLDDLQAAVCSTWMTAVLFLTGDMLGTWNLGSDLKSIINVGLFANALSLPVLFAFLAFCGTGHHQKSWKWPALLLGALLLMHPLSALLAGVFALGLALIEAWQSRGQSYNWKPLLFTLSVGTLLGAHWLFPFWIYRSYMNAEFVGAGWSPAAQFIILNGAVLALASFSKPLVRPLVVTYLILSNFILVGTMWKAGLQFSRLTIYLLFFIPVFLLVWLRSRMVLLVMALIASVVGVQGYLRGGIHPAGVPDFGLPNFGPRPGRILSVAPPSHLPSFHVNHDLIPLRTGNPSLLGLFIESSLNGRFLANLTRTLDPDAHIWGTPTRFLTHQALGKEYASYVRDRLRLFDIRYIYTDLKLENTLDPSLAQTKVYINSYPAPSLNSPEELENLVQRYNTHENLVDFYLYSMGPGELAEPLSYVPSAPGSDWKLTNLKWFLEISSVPIFTDRPVQSGARGARPGEWVKVQEVSRSMDRIVLQIHAEHDIPVLVKVGYFPSWKLTLNGETAPVYRASPNLILISGHGQAVLEFHRPREEYIGLLLSLLGVMLLIFL